MDVLDPAHDVELPLRMGDSALRAPNAHEVAALASEHLGIRDDTPFRLVFARWKRGVSLTTLWRRSATCDESDVAIKQYVGDKADLLARRAPESGPTLLRASGTALWRARDDRELPGLARILDRHRTTRLLREMDALGGDVARWASSTFTLLRYKPEHRAVLRLDLDVREGHKHGAKSRRIMAARVVAPERAARCLRAREGFDRVANDGPWPRWLGAQPRTGLAFETWLDGSVRARDDFSSPRDVGALLARLHAVPVDADAPRARAVQVDAGLLELVDAAGRSGDLAAEWSAFANEPPARSTWIHSDFHPDQLVGRSDGSLGLLDLDELGVGDPCIDLATWIADQISKQPATDFERAAEGLLSGYGAPIDVAHLRRLTALGLHLQAVGCLRRLELNALARAADLLERANDLLGTGSAAR